VAPQDASQHRDSRHHMQCYCLFLLMPDAGLRGPCAVTRECLRPHARYCSQQTGYNIEVRVSEDSETEPLHSWERCFLCTGVATCAETERSLLAVLVSLQVISLFGGSMPESWQSQRISVNVLNASSDNARLHRLAEGQPPLPRGSPLSSFLGVEALCHGRAGTRRTFRFQT